MCIFDTFYSTKTDRIVTEPDPQIPFERSSCAQNKIALCDDEKEILRYLKKILLAQGIALIP
jgi:hypothetical protein